MARAPAPASAGPGASAGALPRWLVPAMLAAALLLITSVSALIFLPLVLTGPGRDVRPAGAVTSALTPDPAFEGISIPEFTLTDQDGGAVTQEILDGRVTILDFIFTNCPLVCPGMSARMQQLAERLEGTSVRFLSISIDPAHDTPEVLRAYGERHNANFSRWVFLTGPAETSTRLTRAIGFALEVEQDREIELPDGSKMNNILHPSKLLLIGPRREVLAMYRFDTAEDFEALSARARASAADFSPRGAR